MFFAALDIPFLGIELLMQVPLYEPYFHSFFLWMGPFWIMLGFGFLNFVYRWTGKLNDFFYYAILVLSLIAILFFLLSGKVHLGHRITPLGVEDQRNLMLHALTSVPAMLGGGWGLVLLEMQRRKETDKGSRQIYKMILCGGVLTMCSIAVCDVILPDFFGTQRAVRLGSSMFVIFLVLVFFSVRRYRFLHFSLDDVALPFFEEMKDAVLWVEDGTKIRKMNRAARKMFGVRGKYLGAEITEFLPNPQRKYVDVTINSERRRLKVTSYFTKKNNIEMLRVFIVRDETEVHRARQVMRRLRDELELEASRRSEQLRQAQRLEALATLSGGIAHEFNNLLTTTMGYTSAALDDVDPDEPIHEDLEEVLNATERARDIIKQMISFSDMENHQFETVDFSGLVKEALKIANLTVPSNVQVSFEFEKDTFISGDKTRLHQAVMNLITNALHAMEPNGGQLKVAVGSMRVVESLPCVNGMLLPGEYVFVRVKDTGVGIQSEYLPRIFEPFFTTKKQGKGTGIGLATVFRAVDEHRGGLKVESVLLKGTMFELLFLRDLEGGAVAPKTQRKSIQPTSVGTILIVDDNKLVLKVCKRILEPMGHTVVGFEMPEDVLAAMAQKTVKCDLALLDYGMPQMDGIALAAHIREIFPKLPILLFSGKMTTSLRQQADKVRLQGCLSKPLSKNQLLEAVDQFLPGGVKR